MESSTVETLHHGARVRDWRHASQARVCDHVEPWQHGAILRASRYPTYYEYNLVRVEDDPGLDVAALEAVAEAALAGLDHLRVDFELVAAADARRDAFTAAGWKSTRLLWMRHERPVPALAGAGVSEVAYEDVEELRRAWHDEDFPDLEYERYRSAAREVAMSREVTVLAVSSGRGARPVGFAQLERLDRVSEITSVYVRPDCRGAGLGTALTRAAIGAADGSELLICADDEDRPKRLYERLGFRTAWLTMQFLKLP
jgi:ribosomal protein S18 acetylase RimI-like enzyme